MSANATHVPPAIHLVSSLLLAITASTSASATASATASTSGSASAQTIRPEALQLPAARTLAREALVTDARLPDARETESHDKPEADGGIRVVDRNGHSWIACGTEAQIDAQQAAHQAHGHNHEFYGPCPGQGRVSGDDAASAGAAGSGRAATGSDEMTSADTDADTNTGHCVSSGSGSTAPDCQSTRALAGQQIRQQLRHHLPQLTRQVPRANDEEDDQ